MAPKGSAFLYTRTEAQPLIKPLVVSWGFRANQATTLGSTYLDILEYTGTRDPAASLSVPAAIQFQQENYWDDVGANCHQLLAWAIDEINELTGLQPLYPAGSDSFYQMATVAIPTVSDLQTFKNHLSDKFKIEIPCIEWDKRIFLRISVQGYNTQTDLDTLVSAVKEYFL